MVNSVKKQLTPKSFKAQEMNKSKGIFDDYAVRKSVQTRESEIQNINKSGNDLVICENGGNVGISTPTPLYKFVVHGSMTATPSYPKVAQFYDTSPQAAGTGGGIGFGGKSTDAGAGADAGQIRAVKTNNVSGNFGFGMSFKIREAGSSAFTEALLLHSNKDVEITGGDFFFTGAGSGLPYGDLYVHANAVGQTIPTATLTQVTTFDTNGESNLTTPDHTTDDITISKTGKYLITLSSAFSGDPNVTWLGGVYKNNGATQLSNLQTKRKLGAGGDVGSISISGIASLTANDTVEVWFQHAEGVNKSITVEELTLSAVMVGG